MKKFLIYSVFQTLFIGFLSIWLSASKDEIIIQHGISFHKSLSTFLFINILLFLLFFILFFSKYTLDKYKKLKIEHEKNEPLYEQEIVIQTINNFRSEVSSNSRYVFYIDKILSQIKEGEKIQKEFFEISENNSLPILKNIAKELESIRVHLLQDAKSIYRRLRIEDESKIEDKINHNDIMLNDAKKLLIETINYLDVKTPSTELDLNNLTESLKDLIELI